MLFRSHDAHAHEAKHGGELTELGAHEGFLETKLDHDAGTLSVWIYLGEEMTDTRPAAAPVLNLMTKDGAKSLTAVEQSGVWVFSDTALKGEPEKARFRFTVGGTIYTPALAHEHAHDHDGEGHGEESDGHDHDGEGHEHDKDDDKSHEGDHDHEKKDG